MDLAINIRNFSNKNLNISKKETNYLFILRDLSYFPASGEGLRVSSPEASLRNWVL